MFYLIKVILFILIAVMFSLQSVGAVVVPWHRNMAAPGIVFLKVGMNPQETHGALVHELCHIQQMRDGRAGENESVLELECSVKEYFAYERIGYEPGMYAVLHYDIP